MSLAHLTLPSRAVEATASFLEQTLGYRRAALPDNIPYEAVWLELGKGQQLHLVYVEEFEVSPFEREFGRHVAVFHPLAAFAELKAALVARGAELMDPLRTTSFDRFFFREPINGYLFEVIDSARAR
jgi:catechol 2,3-dioxygenase-like lactoylglutathione lyase family enzyme